MSERPDLKGISKVNDLSDSRLWKTLDIISDRLVSIERQLAEVVRLEERVNSQQQTLNRYSNRLDNHEQRIHEAELWQASYGDRSSVERLVTNIREDVGSLKKKVDDLESKNDITKGQKDIGKEVLKWVVGFLTAIIVFKITRGTW